MSRRGWVLFLTLGLCWGIPYLFIRIAVADVDPLIVAFGRTALGALILLPFALRAGALRGLREHWRPLLIYTVVEIVGPWFFLGHAETRLNSSTTGLLIAMVPIVAAILVTLTGHDRLSGRRVLGLLLGFAGVAFLVGMDVQAGDALAIGAVLLVVLGYAIGPMIISLRLGDLAPMGVITASLVIAAAAYAPFTPLVWPQRFTVAAVGSIVVLAVVCTAVAFLVMFALIAEVGPARMTLITYVNPVVAIVLGALVLGEPLTLGLAIGFPLVVVGSVLGTAKSRAPTPEGTAAPSSAKRGRPDA